jgi:lipopolysaccharide export system permease protein
MVLWVITCGPRFMNTLNRYIFKQLALSTAAITTILTMVIWLTQSLKSIDIVINHGASFGDLILLVSLLLPDILMILLPISLFLASLIVLNRLINDHEILVMNTLGLSPFEISRPFLVLGALISALLFTISLYFLPISYHQFKNLQFTFNNQYKANLIHEGEFINLNKVTIYVQDKDLDGEVRGVFIFDNRNPDFPITFTAASGQIMEGESGPKILLLNGTRQGKDQRTKGMTFLTFQEYIHEFQPSEKITDTRMKKPSECFIWELFNPNLAPDQTELIHRMRVEGHQRIISPLLPIIFILIGLTFILHTQHTRIHRFVPFAWASVAVSIIQVSIIGSLQFAGNQKIFISVAYILLLLPVALSAYIFKFFESRPLKQ